MELQSVGRQHEHANNLLLPGHFTDDEISLLAKMQTDFPSRTLHVSVYISWFCLLARISKPPLPGRARQRGSACPSIAAPATSPPATPAALPCTAPGHAGLWRGRTAQEPTRPPPHGQHSSYGTHSLQTPAAEAGFHFMLTSAEAVRLKALIGPVQMRNSTPDRYTR